MAHCVTMYIQTTLELDSKHCIQSHQEEMKASWISLQESIKSWKVIALSNPGAIVEDLTERITTKAQRCYFSLLMPQQ